MRRLTILYAIAAVLVMGSLPPSAFAEKRGVKIDGKEPAEYVAEQTGKSWAVVIGIDKYEKVEGLKYAVADAKAVADLFKQRGFEVSALYDQGATYQHILTELGTRLVNRVSEHDRVVIFFAGHGETHKARGGREMGYLLPIGGDLHNLAGTAINMSMIRDLTDALPAKQVLFLVDVCYGGIAGGMRSPGKVTVDEHYLKMITRERGRQLITAGGKDQQALEDPGWGHSVFTYYLLQGLEKGLADLDGDGIIPASELHTYLKKRVHDAARLKHHQQVPEMWKLVADSGEFVFFTTARGTGESVATAASALDLEAERQRLREEHERLLADERAKLEAERRQRTEADRTRMEAERRQLEEERKKIEEARVRYYTGPLESLAGKWYWDYQGYRFRRLVEISGSNFVTYTPITTRDGTFLRWNYANPSCKGIIKEGKLIGFFIINAGPDEGRESPCTYEISSDGREINEICERGVVVCNEKLRR